MCMSVHVNEGVRWAACHVAREDIKCWKVLARRTGDGKLVAPYMLDEYRLGGRCGFCKRFATRIDTFSYDDTFAVARYGYHTFRRREDAIAFARNETEARKSNFYEDGRVNALRDLVLVGCTIPKGELYYVGFHGVELADGYCSSDLLVGSEAEEIPDD